MTQQEFEKIFEETVRVNQTNGFFKGLQIIYKYIKDRKDIITGAEHDVVYSVDVDDLLNEDIRIEDTIELAKLGWLVDVEEGCLFYDV